MMILGAQYVISVVYTCVCYSPCMQYGVSFMPRLSNLKFVSQLLIFSKSARQNPELVVE